MKIAVLGLGRMGAAAAERLLEGGHDLTIWNRSSGKADKLVASGAHRARSPAEAAAGAEVTLTNLADDGAVRAVALGEDGVRAGIGEGVYADTSTISPALSRELAGCFDRFVSMPILGAPQAVRAGEATYLAGGPDELLDAVAPVVDALGGKIRRYGRPEVAAVAKLTVNLMLLSAVVTLSEAFTVGRSGGLSDEELSDLLGGAPVVAPALSNRFEAVLQGNGPVWWTTVLAAKDARLAGGAAAAAGKQLPLANVVEDLYQAAADAGFDGEDMAAVAQLYR